MQSFTGLLTSLLVQGSLTNFCTPSCSCFDIHNNIINIYMLQQFYKFIEMENVLRILSLCLMCVCVSMCEGKLLDNDCVWYYEPRLTPLSIFEYPLINRCYMSQADDVKQELRGFLTQKLYGMLHRTMVLYCYRGDCFLNQKQRINGKLKQKKNNSQYHIQLQHNTSIIIKIINNNTFLSTSTLLPILFISIYMMVLFSNYQICNINLFVIMNYLLFSYSMHALNHYHHIIELVLFLILSISSLILIMYSIISDNINKYKLILNTVTTITIILMWYSILQLIYFTFIINLLPTNHQPQQSKHITIKEQYWIKNFPYYKILTYYTLILYYLYTKHQHNNNSLFLCQFLLILTLMTLNFIYHYRIYKAAQPIINSVHIIKYGHSQSHQCPICLQCILCQQFVSRTECGHYFHPECLRRWVMKRGICPVDRSMLDTTNM